MCVTEDDLYGCMMVVGYSVGEQEGEDARAFIQ